MLCKKMVESRGTVHPCGQCLFCRINQKREWISRLLLEAASHEENQFWTLTYEDERLPTTHPPIGGTAGAREAYFRQAFRSDSLSVSGQPGSLFKPDLARFFKRVRKNIGEFRYYAVGEYGEKYGRPHYHVLAFGIQCSPQSLCELWKLGAVHIGDVESASIQYCVEYALKREKSDSLVDLRRLPEFAVMSRNPGIGSYAVGEFRQAILKSPPLPTGELLIPDTFRVLGREYPVPRFVRNELENEGFLSARKAIRAYYGDKEILSQLLSRSPVARAEFKKFEVFWSDNPAEVSANLRSEMMQKIRNAESRQRIFGVRHETL